MSIICYLLDEHMPSALRAQLLRRAPDLVVWMIGDPGAPRYGTLDPDILLWCEANGFLFVTRNRKSMPVHLQEHLASRHHIPGIFVVPPQMTVGVIIDQLLLVWGASEVEEYRDLLLYLPLTD